MKRGAIFCLVFALLVAPPSWSEESPAAPDAPKQAGSEVPAPKRTKFVMPKYPPEALARGERSMVVLEIVIDESGKVAETKVLHGGTAFAAAAQEAARHWRYEVTKVGGRPVKVRLTVPLSFAVKLPEITRVTGIPELRQGAAPQVPEGTDGRGAAVVAQVEVDADGRVAGEPTILRGESPWREALLEAIGTWRFASTDEGKALTFEVHADFKSRGGKVDLELMKPRPIETEVAAAPTVPPAIEPAPAITPEPRPEPTSAPVAEPTFSPTSAAAPEEPASAATPAAPPVEIVSGPPAAEPVSPVVAPQENGMSAIRDVELAPGIPDLVRGRRPVSPPLARMASLEGDVKVRFSIDSGGAVSVTEVEGPAGLKEAADSLVRSWSFRRTAAQRIYAIAQVSYRMSGSTAKVRPTD